MYEIIVSVILGVIQGISEFLPISSTAHLLISGNILSGGYDLGLSTSNFIQFGTLIAILVFYRGEINSLFVNLYINLTNPRQFNRFIDTNKKWLVSTTQNNLTQKDKYDIILLQLIIATIPLIISALFLRNLIENLRNDLRYIAMFLIFGGILITFAEIIYRLISKKTNNNDELFSLKQVLIIGVFQAFAIFPGVSRSGSTLAGALLTGRNRKEGVYFSFLLSIPAILLVSLYDSVKVLLELLRGNINFFPSASGLVIVNNSSFSLSLVSLIVAFATSYFVGIWCLRWLLKYLSKNDSKVFIYYRIIIAILILIGFYYFK